jgi:transcriptional accessory protein Tex/SPT6
MNIVQTIASELSIQAWQVEAVIKLIDEGNTIPFIARYRKEAHGTLDDTQLRTLDERLRYLRALEERRSVILASIEEQGKLTPELKKQIEDAATQSALEDLYLPYRPKRRTRATIAKERGLEPLAQEILAQEMNLPAAERAAAFVDPEKEVKDAAAALQGAQDIIAEGISDRADIRAMIREKTFDTAVIVSEVKKDMDQPGSVYEQYFHHEEPAAKIPGHRILALNRGEKEKVLGVSVRVVGKGDKITAQMPAAGTKMEAGGILVIYAGDAVEEDSVTVPDLTGKSAAAANQLLIDAGLNVRITGTKHHLTGAGAKVISQSHAPGEKVAPGTVITLVFTTEGETE